MEDWQQRVIDEKRELDEKASRLNAFLDAHVEGDIAMDEARLLRIQSAIMDAYTAVLGVRIARWDNA